MSDTNKLAIAAHLHVLLRRKTGRVTDTEWMAVNAEYAQEIVRFARQRAREDQVPELETLADRLDNALHPALNTAQRRTSQDVAAPAARPLQGPPLKPAPEVPRYVGGIR